MPGASFWEPARRRSIFHPVALTERGLAVPSALDFVIRIDAVDGSVGPGRRGFQNADTVFIGGRGRVHVEFACHRSPVLLRKSRIKVLRMVRLDLDPAAGTYPVNRIRVRIRSCKINIHNPGRSCNSASIIQCYIYVSYRHGYVPFSIFHGFRPWNSLVVFKQPLELRVILHVLESRIEADLPAV